MIENLGVEELDELITPQLLTNLFLVAANAVLGFLAVLGL